MWNIYSGQKVVFLGPADKGEWINGSPEYPPVDLTPGEIYTVKTVEPWTNITLITVEEVPSYNHYESYFFRPIETYSIEQLRRLTLPTPTLEPIS